MTGQQFYEYYCQKINNAKTSSELRDIQNEIFEFSMKSCANGTFKEYRSYVEQLYSFFNENAVNMATAEVRAKHRR